MLANELKDNTLFYAMSGELFIKIADKAVYVVRDAEIPAEVVAVGRILSKTESLHAIKVEVIQRHFDRPKA